VVASYVEGVKAGRVSLVNTVNVLHHPQPPLDRAIAFVAGLLYHKRVLLHVDDELGPDLKITSAVI
jgi:hypothetical protein